MQGGSGSERVGASEREGGARGRARGERARVMARDGGREGAREREWGEGVGLTHVLFLSCTSMLCVLQRDIEGRWAAGERGGRGSARAGMMPGRGQLPVQWDMPMRTNPRAGKGR